MGVAGTAGPGGRLRAKRRGPGPCERQRQGVGCRQREAPGVQPRLGPVVRPVDWTLVVLVEGGWGPCLRSASSQVRDVLYCCRPEGFRPRFLGCEPCNLTIRGGHRYCILHRELPFFTSFRAMVPVLASIGRSECEISYWCHRRVYVCV